MVVVEEHLLTQATAEYESNKYLIVLTECTFLEKLFIQKYFFLSAIVLV